MSRKLFALFFGLVMLTLSLVSCAGSGTQTAFFGQEEPASIPDVPEQYTGLRNPYVEDPDQVKVIQKAKRMRRSGLSIRSIAERYQRQPVDVSTKQPTLTVPEIEQLSLQVRGFRDKDELCSSGAHHLIGTPLELLEILKTGG